MVAGAGPGGKGAPEPLGEEAAPPVPAGGLDIPAAPPALDPEAFPGESQLTLEERNRWLVIHVSLARTIMTYDIAEQRDTEAELNDVLACMAWGTIDENTREFVLQSEDPTMEPAHPSMVSYAEFVARTYPLDPIMEDEAREENAQMAASLRCTFTEPGQPGVKFRPMFEQLVKNLAHSNKALVKVYDMKKTILKESEAPPDPTKTDVQNIMRFGRHQVLPSFWQLLVHLVKIGRRFSLVFRTFSEEQLELFLPEYQVFCEGKHPAYSGQNKTPKVPLMSGEKGSKNYRLGEANIGRMDRSNGRLVFANRPAGHGEPLAADAGGFGAAEAEGGTDGGGEDTTAARVATSPTTYNFPPFHAVYAGMKHQILGHEGGANVAAIIDDFQHWEDMDRSSEAGKLLLVDHAGSLAETTVQHLFFDGHIQRDTSYGVDVRDVVNGEPLKYADAAGMFFHRVDFCKAMLDQDYFVRALEDCENRMSQAIVQTRRVADALAEHQEKPDAMKKLPPKEYLYRTVIPALLPALEACQRDRPADPIEFIAFYLLRHPKQYSKTLKA
eukprot:TRINITY_DN76100_c0_g1_i1.p1 TRINITY_DN76100_c0_g1~~TRINITY_DN76100_c0_g1_i1.p1  ORF type:complete len:555 (-),score=121.48 TRINITY_DN76100_c0_g1_i1:77-1741(-)